jgi:ketosteroid isomerase-like protein
MSTATLNVKVSTDEAEIFSLIEQLHKAHHDKNADAIAAPYAEDAEVFNLSPPLVHHGVSASEKQAWLDTWETPVELEARDLKITVSGDFAFCHGFVRMSGAKAGGMPISFWMRATVCLEREAGAWQIVHEHTSVPFYMDGSLRPAFDLNP